MLFVQGRLDGNGGDKISTRVYWNGGEGGSALVQQPHYYDKGETTEHDSLGVVASAGVGYRRLSEHEHAYVGGNIFYDYAVNDKLSRVGVGMEYVSGLNTISANVYHGLSEKKTEPYLFWNQWKTKSSSEHPKNMFYINQHKWNSIHGVNLDMHTLAGSIVKILVTVPFQKEHQEELKKEARSKVLNKVKRSDILVESYWEQNYREFGWNHV